MDKLLFWATDALSSSLMMARGASLLWGIFSVLLSPCHLGTIPLVIGMVGSSTRDSTKRGSGVLLGSSFAGGMLGAIAALGAVVAVVGHALQQYRTVTNYVVAAIFLLAGLHLVGLLSLPLPSLTVRGGQRSNQPNTGDRPTLGFRRWTLRGHRPRWFIDGIRSALSRLGREIERADCPQDCLWRAGIGGRRWTRLHCVTQARWTEHDK